MAYCEFTDQLGRAVRINLPPQRIISLVPSQTELLFDLGLADKIVGITKFCIHPQEWSKTKTKIGGTKNFRLDEIKKLQPDLIIGNKEENYEDGILELEKTYPVWMSDVSSFEQALEMVKSLGEITTCEKQAQEIIQSIVVSFDKLNRNPLASVLYLIWKSPWIAVGRNTFIDNMLSKIGLENSIQLNRYPELSEDQIQRLHPDIVMLSSEPYPFKDRHLVELQKLLPDSKIKLVDGEFFSWYGSRMIQAPAYFNSLRF